MTKYKTAGSKANSIESFQHQMLALVTGACSRTNAEQLAKITAELPVLLKLGKLCERMKRKAPRNLYDLIYGDTDAPAFSRKTRAQNDNNRLTWRGLDKKDFGDMMNMKACLYERDDRRLMFDKNEPDHATFNEKEVKDWVKENNKRIRTLARRRFLGLLD